MAPAFLRTHWQDPSAHPQGPAGHPLTSVRVSAVLGKLVGCSWDANSPAPRHLPLDVGLRWAGVLSLLGLRAAKPVAPTAHRQGWGEGLGLCAGSLAAAGPSLPVPRQREGMLALSKGPLTGCPPRPGWPCGAWCAPRRGAGRPEPCPACSVARVARPPRGADPCRHGATDDTSVQLIPPPWHPAAETLGEPRRAFPQDQPRLERRGRAQAGVNGKRERAKPTPRAPGSQGRAADHARDAHQERYRSHTLPPSPFSQPRG